MSTFLGHDRQKCRENPHKYCPICDDFDEKHSGHDLAPYQKDGNDGKPAPKQ